MTTTLLIIRTAPRRFVVVTMDERSNECSGDLAGGNAERCYVRGVGDKSVSYIASNQWLVSYRTLRDARQACEDMLYGEAERFNSIVRARKLDRVSQ